VIEKLAQLQSLSAENEMLKLRSAVLEATVKGREYHVSAAAAALTCCMYCCSFVQLPQYLVMLYSAHLAAARAGTARVWTAVMFCGVRRLWRGIRVI
jgi:hypothetical protein